jgi:hypothetical protein
LVAEELALPAPVPVLAAGAELDVLLELLQALALMTIATIAARDATLTRLTGNQVLRDFTRFPLPMDEPSFDRPGHTGSLMSFAKRTYGHFLRFSMRPCFARRQRQCS